MSYRHIEPRELLPSQVISGTTAVKSGVHDMRTMIRGALQFHYGAGLVAHIAVYASCAPAVNMGPPADASFFDLLLSLPDINNIAGDWGVDLTAYGYPWYKAVITPVSGTGTVVVWANAKGS